MSDLVRMSFTIEKALVDQMEALLEKGGYGNRSEFIRDLLRDRLVREQWAADKEVLGTVTIVYNHEVRRLSNKLTSLQHEHHDAVLASTHVHLDKHLCAETIMLRARPHIVEEMAEQLRQQKGVLHAAVAISSAGLEV